jgi:hypothetical protein
MPVKHSAGITIFKNAWPAVREGCSGKDVKLFLDADDFVQASLRSGNHPGGALRFT